MAEKNAAALLREGTRTIHVSFYSDGGQTLDANSRTYTYVTEMAVEVGDHVVVPVGSKAHDSLRHNRPTIAKVVQVDDDAIIQPESDTYYKWVVAVLPKAVFQGYEENCERNAKIEQMVQQSYRQNARVAFRQAIISLAGNDSQLTNLLAAPTQVK